MDKILETTHIEFDKSAFLIDLVKHDSGVLYIEMLQIINGKVSKGQKIKINPSILSDIINVLQAYQDKMPMTIPWSSVKISTSTGSHIIHLSDADQQRIQDRYLKGISLLDLTLQFDQPEELIKQVLRNKGIKIVSNELPKSKKYWRRKRQ